MSELPTKRQFWVLTGSSPWQKSQLALICETAKIMEARGKRVLIYLYKALWVLSANSEHQFVQLCHAAMEQGCRQIPQAGSIPLCQTLTNPSLLQGRQHPPKCIKPAQEQEQPTQRRHWAPPLLTQEPISNSISPLAYGATSDCSLIAVSFVCISTGGSSRSQAHPQEHPPWGGSAAKPPSCKGNAWH